MNKINKLSPAIFLDRDGTINHDKNYLSDEKDLILYKNIEKPLHKFKEMGFKIIIVTNQSGIARKYFTITKLKKINSKLVSMLKKLNVEIDGIYYCPHGPNDTCNCRKPKIGMALQAAKELNIDLTKSYMIGDSIRDYLFGYNFGGKGILVLTGHGKKQFTKVKDEKQKPLAIVKNLLQTVNIIKNDINKNKN
jgi:D,D-heptose 1,7-bisphosphate phosphatase